ncbi:hypothetical protein CGCA056_v014767 [Colletotrichum aenigma]|uniref:uncharacterized protein n=1 Tax=Colletotrichum aenigma TaxID=1215731 RepID=UPI001872ED1C|nr:uncharacterized protein CGCA056_v014767 [Colletotrichum aenigma]KAF5502009.1 hypothetical protein CGCA056_v014767 [Colletotrichum aenigma]
MRFTQLILSIFLFFSFVAALPVPAQADGEALEALEARANNGGKKGGGGNKGSSKSTSKEVKGIDKNIGIQKAESKDVKKVKQAEGTKNFPKEKANLQKDIKAGQNQRAKNQKNADPKNKQLNDGLKKVQGAQAKESKQAKGLTGNPKKDNATLNKLGGEFKDGRKQNEKNKQAAKKGGK